MPNRMAYILPLGNTTKVLAEQNEGNTKRCLFIIRLTLLFTIGKP
jgi:hypothetical protein